MQSGSKTVTFYTFDGNAISTVKHNFSKSMLDPNSIPLRCHQDQRLLLIIQPFPEIPMEHIAFILDNV